MLTNIEFDSSPILPDEIHPLLVQSDAIPTFVAIECFREPPRPAELQPCQECGSYQIKSKQYFDITASLSAFSEKGGYLRVQIWDESRDSREFQNSLLEKR